MKRSLSILAVSFAVFVTACAVSYLLRSDGFGLSDVQDGALRMGFPLIFWLRGGFIYKRIFRLAALMIDLAVALVVGVLISLLYAKAKHHSLT